MEILRLMGACNNRCRFCMVHDEMSKSCHKPLSEYESIIDKMEEGERLDLFGGEPTLYPHFWDLLRLATDKKLKISIASNGRAFASDKFINRLTQFPAFSIRTSLYGLTADAHQFYTQVKGSFHQTISGIENLCKKGNPPLVNIVMLEKNIEDLEQIVELLAGIGVQTIKFASVYGREDIQDFIIDYQTVKPNLNRALQTARQKNISVQVEKTPYCLAPAFINDFLPENAPAMIRQAEFLYLHTEKCNQCRLKAACCGVLRTYHDIFADSGLTPFDSMPAASVRSVSFTDLPLYQPECESDFVSIDYGEQDLDIGNLFKSLQYMNRLKMEYVQVFFVKNGTVSV